MKTSDFSYALREATILLPRTQLLPIASVDLHPYFAWEHMRSLRTPAGLSHILPFVVRGVAFLSSESVGTHVRFRSSISSLSLRPVFPCPTLSPRRRRQESKDSVPDAGLACPDGIFTHLIGTPCLGAPPPSRGQVPLQPHFFYGARSAIKKTGFQRAKPFGGGQGAKPHL